MSIVFKHGNQELEIELTPSCYLDEVGREERERVMQNIEEAGLKVVHDKDNRYDDLALEVFSDGVSIGYIRKRYVDNDKSVCIDRFFMIYLDQGCQKLPIKK